MSTSERPTPRRVVVTGITGTLGDALGRVCLARADHVIGITHRRGAESLACDRLVCNAQRSETDAHELLDLDPDVLILNAGAIETEIGPAGLPQASAVASIHAINAVFPALVAIAAGERGAKRRLDVVAVGSIADGSPSCFGPVYHASKAALHHFYAGTAPIAHAAHPNVRLRLYRPGVIQGPLSWAPVLRLNERGRKIRARRCDDAPAADWVAESIVRWIEGDAWVGGDREPLSFRALKLCHALAPNTYARLQHFGWRRGSRFTSDGHERERED